MARSSQSAPGDHRRSRGPPLPRPEPRRPGRGSGDCPVGVEDTADHQAGRPAFAALVDHAHRDEAFIAAQRRFVEGLVQPTVDVLEQAQQRGELAPTVDCSVAATIVTGPFFQQYLVMQEDVGDELIAEVMSQFLRSHPAP